MTLNKILTLLLIAIIIFILFSCSKEPTDPDNNDKDNHFEPVEPEMVLVVDVAGILSPYYIGKYELTNIEFVQFVLDQGYADSVWWSEDGMQTKNDLKWKAPKHWGYENPDYKNDPFSSFDNTPVHGISYYEAEAYCNWLSRRTGKNYKIPTLEQWQIAAEGPENLLYPWGNEWTDNKANYVCYTDTLLQVDCFPEGKSYFNCYNMIGNVYEFLDIGDIDKSGSISHTGINIDSIVETKISMTNDNWWTTRKFLRYNFYGLRLVKE